MNNEQININSQTKIPAHAPLSFDDEQILVIKRSKIFFDSSWQGINQNNTDKYLEIINKERQFLPRSEMENDPTYKQIIPYIIYNFKDKYFLMQRRKKASEQRLQSKFSFGIGGHIRQEDMKTDNIIDWTIREFNEEIDYNGSYNIKLFGLLNDDSNAVGQVHMGLVFILQGDSEFIKVKEELQSGELLTLSECRNFYDRMESWSQIVFDSLKNNKFA